VAEPCTTVAPVGAATAALAAANIPTAADSLTLNRRKRLPAGCRTGN
jgi:hypothetical protein